MQHVSLFLGHYLSRRSGKGGLLTLIMMAATLLCNPQCHYVAPCLISKVLRYFVSFKSSSVTFHVTKVLEEALTEDEVYL